MWMQKNISIKSISRGFHIITDQVTDQIPEIKTIKIGILHLFIKHTSASLTINENADKTVRNDFEKHFNEMVFQTIIQRNVKLSEAPSYGENIISYDASSKGAENYLSLAHELIQKN